MLRKVRLSRFLGVRVPVDHVFIIFFLFVNTSYLAFLIDNIYKYFHCIHIYLVSVLFSFSRLHTNYMRFMSSFCFSIRHLPSHTAVQGRSAAAESNRSQLSASDPAFAAEAGRRSDPVRQPAAQEHEDMCRHVHIQIKVSRVAQSPQEVGFYFVFSFFVSS